MDRAVSAHGRSRTNFVREAAVRAVEDVLMDQRLVRASAEFIALLKQPAEASLALVRVLRQPALWDSTNSGRSEHSTALHPYRAAARSIILPVAWSTCDRSCMGRTRCRLRIAASRLGAVPRSVPPRWWSCSIVNAFGDEATAFWLGKGLLPSSDNPIIMLSAAPGA